MLKGGVIMDVTNVEEARIAEEAGAVAVMALERVPAGEFRDAHVCRNHTSESCITAFPTLNNLLRHNIISSCGLALRASSRLIVYTMPD